MIQARSCSNMRSTSKHPPAHPASTALNPSYPNPFNSETVLSYTLPTASDIRLEVFTLNGQRVAVLHEGFQAAGYHTIAMDASDWASGVYLYRLTTPEGRFVQKFYPAKVNIERRLLIAA